MSEFLGLPRRRGSVSSATDESESAAIRAWVVEQRRAFARRQLLVGVVMGGMFYLFVGEAVGIVTFLSSALLGWHVWRSADRIDI